MLEYQDKEESAGLFRGFSYKKEHQIATRSVKTSQVGETLDEENKRLRRENKLLKQERDILKKATAYFAKETL